MQHSQFVSPKKIKSSKFSKKRYVLNSAINNPKSYASITPKIHQGIWPNFCLKHLQTEPEACSAWSKEKNGNLQLDFFLTGNSEAQIDRNLIEKLRYLAHLIPQRKHGNKRYCDYAYCPTCCQTVLRGVGCFEEEDIDEENNAVYSYIYVPIYKCGCLEKGWLDLNDLWNKNVDIYEGWQFCRAPTIYYGYFDWHHQTYFLCLKNFLIYQKENLSYNCYWPQSDCSAKAISDTVYIELKSILEISKVDTANFTPYAIERTLHGFLSNLLTHSFFLFTLPRCFFRFRPIYSS